MFGQYFLRLLVMMEFCYCSLLQLVISLITAFNFFLPIFLEFHGVAQTQTRGFRICPCLFFTFMSNLMHLRGFISVAMVSSAF